MPLLPIFISNRDYIPFPQITAAKGAEEFYNTEDNSCRMEGMDLARERDTRAAEVKTLLLLL